MSDTAPAPVVGLSAWAGGVWGVYEPGDEAVRRFTVGDTTDAPLIALRNSFFFRQDKFIYGDNEPQHTFTNGYGLVPQRLTSQFKDVLGLHPEALREASRSHAYKFLQYGGVFMAEVGLLLPVVGDREYTDGAVLGIVLGGIVVAQVANMLARNRVKEGVRIFNERQAAIEDYVPIDVPRDFTDDEPQQDSRQAGISIGLKAGFNSATVSGDTEETEGLLDKGSRSGFVGGAFLQVPLSGSLVLQPEILYTMKGVTSTLLDSGETTGATATVKIDYLEIPVLLGFMVPTSSSLSAGLFAGPFMALKLSARGSASFEGASIEVDLDTVSSTDFGVAFGAQAGSGPFGVDLRYTIGLQNINIDPEAPPGSSAKSRTLSLTGFYRFGG